MATTLSPAAPAAARAMMAPNMAQRVTWALSDVLTMTKRNLLVWSRVPAYLVFTVVQPVMFTLLFRYVFGGAIHVDTPGGYIGYLMPGIIGQTAAFGSIGTAVALSREAQEGVVDRFRSMPMARGAFLAGRLAADTCRIFITIVVIIGIGYAVGFRFMGGPGSAVAMVALSLAFGLSVCCVSAFIGLAIRNEESVQAFGLIWIFPLTFVSAAFVPIASMPGWLQAFAINQPVTIVIEALRSLALGGPLYTHMWESVLWIAGIMAFFSPLAVRAYRRAS